jgi:hypothetical protein
MEMRSGAVYRVSLTSGVAVFLARINRNLAEVGNGLHADMTVCDARTNGHVSVSKKRARRR